MKITRRTFIELASGGAVFASLPSLVKAQTGKSSVIVQVTGVRTAAGKIVIGMWSSEAGFPKEMSKAFRRATVAIVDGKAVATFAEVPFGDYAVAVFHDENNNGKMDSRFPGIPTEGVGSSNNPHPRFSAPSFGQCRFEVRDPEKVVLIKMLY